MGGRNTVPGEVGRVSGGKFVGVNAVWDDDDLVGRQSCVIDGESGHGMTDADVPVNHLPGQAVCPEVPSSVTFSHANS